MKNLLLLSNGLLPNQTYVQYALPWLKEHFEASSEHRKKVLFVPFALKDNEKFNYLQIATEALSPIGIDLVSARDELAAGKSPKQILKEVNGVFVAGGNTFRLLDELQRTGLLYAIRDAVENGMPYAGASAGSVVAGPDIKTTNDMPIVQPKSFDAMGLVPFNINAHYVKGKFYYQGEHGNLIDRLKDNLQDFVGKIRNFFTGEKEQKELDALLKMAPYNGETRDKRLKEFHEENDNPVIGLREGGALLINGDRVELLGNDPSGKPLPATIIEKGTDLEDKYQEVTDGKLLSLMMRRLNKSPYAGHEGR